MHLFKKEVPRPQGSMGKLRQRKSYFGFIHPNVQYDFECTCHTSKGICCTVETLGMHAEGIIIVFTGFKP